MLVERLKFYSFSDPNCFIQGTHATHQIEYLHSYLSGLGATWVIEETEYFDRDFLAEYSAFYSVVSHVRTPKTRRLHFFNQDILEIDIDCALNGDETCRKRLQDAYIGFTVIRPLESTPLGRTIFKWYPETQPATPRVNTPAREYTVHLIGIPLKIIGLPWQQQDGGVGACATVALWTMLHSSAFAEYHSVPTTVKITEAGNFKNSNGNRMFPSGGMHAHQISDAISNLGLAPVAIRGEIPFNGDDISFFSKERFTGFTASIIRSGYPVLVAGALRNQSGLFLGGHAVCAVGFRDAKAIRPKKGKYNHQDQEISYLYINDDNIGPNARYEIFEETSANGSYVGFRRSSPFSSSSFHASYVDFIPLRLYAAVHDEMRLSFDKLFLIGEAFCNRISITDNAVNGTHTLGFTITCKILKCFDYLEDEIGNTLRNRPADLIRVKRELFNANDMMGLHVGIIRIGDGDIPLIDIIVDTTDSPHNTTAIAHVVYDPRIYNLLQYYMNDPSMLHSTNGLHPNIGQRIVGYS